MINKRKYWAEKDDRNFVYSGNIQMQKFVNWIYKDEPIYMLRKYEKLVKNIRVRQKRNLLYKI